MHGSCLRKVLGLMERSCNLDIGNKLVTVANEHSDVLKIGGRTAATMFELALMSREVDL